MRRPGTLLTDERSGEWAGKHDPDAPEERSPLVSKVFSLPADLDYRLRMISARRGVPKVEIVRQALAEHLAYDSQGAPREAVFLPPALLERLTEAAARRGVTPERLATELLAGACGPEGGR